MKNICWKAVKRNKRKVGQKERVETKCTSSEIGVRHAIVNITSTHLDVGGDDELFMIMTMMIVTLPLMMKRSACRGRLVRDTPPLVWSQPTCS